MKLEELILSATTAGAQFDCPLKDLPFVSIEKILRYGFQRWVNDYANSKGNGESDQTKRDLASVRIGDLIKGEFQTRSQAPKASDEINVRRFVTLSAISSADKKKLSALPNKGVSKLDEIWQSNETVLKPLFDAEWKRREEKAKTPKIALSGLAI